jgi:hypothetical protein
MNSQDVLQKAKAAVAAVESKLQNLNDAEKKVTELSEAIEGLVQEESDLLAGEGSEEQKTKALLRLRASSDVKKSNLGKLLIETEALREEAIELGIHSDKFICAIRDALVNCPERVPAPSRSAAVLTELGKLFKKNVLLELKRFVSYSLPVDEIEGNGHDRFVWVRTRQDIGLANASKLRAEFNRLSALAEVEPELEIIVGSDW